MFTNACDLDSVMTCRITFTSVLIQSGSAKRLLHLEFLRHNLVYSYLFLV